MQNLQYVIFALGLLFGACGTHAGNTIENDRDEGLRSDAPLDSTVDAAAILDAAIRDEAVFDASPIDASRADARALDAGPDSTFITTTPDAALDGNGRIDAEAGAGPQDSGLRDSALDSGRRDGSISPSIWPNFACAPTTSGTVPAFANGTWTVSTVDSRTELVGQYYATAFHGSGTSINVLRDHTVAIGYFTNEFICSSEAGALGWAVSNASGWTLSSRTCNLRGYWPMTSIDRNDNINMIFSGAAPNNPHWTYLARWTTNDVSGWSGAVDSYVSSFARTATVLSDCDGNRLVVTDGGLKFASTLNAQPTQIATLARGGYQPFAAHDAGGRLHVVMNAPVSTGPSSSTYMARYFVTRGRDVVEEDPTGGETGSVVGFGLIGGTQPILTYRTRDAAMDRIVIRVAIRQANDTWEQQTLSTDSLSDSALAIGGDETFVMVGNRVHRRSANGQWSDQTFASLGVVRFPSLLVDNAGHLHAAFYRVGARAGSNRDYPASVHHAVFQ